MTRPDHALVDLTLADLLADAALVRLPAPRAPRGTGARVIHLGAPASHALEIPAATIDLVEGYADSHL